MLQKKQCINNHKISKPCPHGCQTLKKQQQQISFIMYHYSLRAILHFLCWNIATPTACITKPVYNKMKTVNSKPPKIPFGVVACTLSDNLSRNSCIHRYGRVKMNQYIPANIYICSFCSFILPPLFTTVMVWLMLQKNLKSGNVFDNEGHVLSETALLW